MVDCFVLILKNDQRYLHVSREKEWTNGHLKVYIFEDFEGFHVLK
jgi:hypothetical protein